MMAPPQMIAATTADGILGKVFTQTDALVNLIAEAPVESDDRGF
jgi:hypothetical protein